MNLTPPTNLANAIAPFAPVGRQPVGEESTDSKDSRFKSVEKSAESARGENRRGPEDRPNEVEERERLRINDDEERRQQSAEEEAAQDQEDKEESEQLAARNCEDELRLAQDSRRSESQPQAGTETEVHARQAIDLNRHLVDIGVIEPRTAVGSFFDQNV